MADGRDAAHAFGAALAVGHCDSDGPRLRFPDVHRGKIHVAKLHRGLRLHSSEDAVVFGALGFATTAQQSVERVVKRGRTITIKLSPQIRRRLKAGAKLDYWLDARDANGHPSSTPGNSSVTVTR